MSLTRNPSIGLSDATRAAINTGIWKVGGEIRKESQKSCACMCVCMCGDPLSLTGVWPVRLGSSV